MTQFYAPPGLNELTRNLMKYGVLFHTERDPGPENALNNE